MTCIHTCLYPIVTYMYTPFCATEIVCVCVYCIHKKVSIVCCCRLQIVHCLLLLFTDSTLFVVVVYR